MKNTIYSLLRNALIIAIITLSYQSFAQSPPPPPGGASGDENSDGNRNGGGGGAPIGGGLFILLGLGAVYGGKKVYDLRKEKLEE